MIIRTITSEEVLQFSTRDESHFFDRKALGINGRSVQKISAGFANADGGEFVVGIADDRECTDCNARWSGASKIEDFNGLLQAMQEIRPIPDLKYEFLKSDVRVGYVLRVYVEKSSILHKTSDGTIYVRKGAQTLPLADTDEIMRLTFAKGAASYEDRILKDVPPEHITESPIILSFLSDYSPKSDPLDFCIKQNLIDYHTWDARVAAVLLFHLNPSAALPTKCGVKITRYETKEEDPERDHLAEQVTIEGPLYLAIHQTIETIKRIMSAVNVWTPSGELKKLEYPPETIWEVVVNALIHRDYSISDDVHILIFNNRIEVQSPGKLPGNVTVENILQTRFSRNSKVVRTLNRYKDPPNKDMGEGLNTAFQRMKEWKLKSPEISEDGNYVKVVLPHAPLATPAEAILRYLSKNRIITNQQARDITGIKSENSMKNEFNKLKKEKMLDRVPGLEGPKAAWRLTVKGKKEAERISTDG